MCLAPQERTVGAVEPPSWLDRRGHFGGLVRAIRLTEEVEEGSTS